MESEHAVSALSALAQPTRLRVFRLLMKAGSKGLPAGEIAASENVPHNTMSTHLAILTRAGLVRSHRESRSVIYVADLDGTSLLLAFLVSNCCEDRPEICSPLLEIAELSACKPSRLSPLNQAAEGGVVNVLFLCTANSARSIMAEAILNDVGKGRFRAFSAGSKPAGKPMPETLKRLESLGHDVSQLRSKSWSEFLEPDSPRVDVVIALCDILRGQTCPDFGRGVVSASWPLPDPNKFDGTLAERVTMLNEVYSSLQRRIQIFAGLPLAALDRRALKKRLDEIGGGRVAALLKAG